MGGREKRTEGGDRGLEYQSYFVSNAVEERVGW